MTREEALKLIEENDVALVRINPRSKQGSWGVGWGRGILVDVLLGEAVVQPMSHRRTEKIELKFLKPWKSKLRRSA
jgi:hypothetical protein